jgi:hypothetical protein
VTGSQWRVPVCSGTHIVDRSDKFSLSTDGSSAEFPESYGIDDMASTDTTSAVADGERPWPQGLWKFRAMKELEAPACQY